MPAGYGFYGLKMVASPLVFKAEAVRRKRLFHLPQMSMMNVLQGVGPLAMRLATLIWLTGAVLHAGPGRRPSA